jgi:hypothetical protein
MQKMQSIKAYVDQINGDVALLLLGDDGSIKVAVPVEWLPPDVQEGQVLRVTFAVDKKATEDARKRTQGLLDSLGNNP